MLGVILILICLSIVIEDANLADSTESDYETLSILRNHDENLDLRGDEEYDDLRAELLAYQDALASLGSRRSLISTPCWHHGGICINYKLCPGYRQLTEVPGCKNRLNVCCFVWNQYEVRDFKDLGIDNAAFPWSSKHEFGGGGVIEVTPSTKKKKHSRNTTEKVKEKPLSMLLSNYGLI